MTETISTSTPAGGGASAASERPRRARAVLWWAALGAGVIALQAYVYIGWITSSDFTPTPTGVDPVPQVEKVFAWVLQPLFGIMAVLALAWVIRGCRRAGRVTLDAKLLLAGYLQVWLDPVGGLIRTEFFFNAYYLNRGSWVAHIPGALTPNGHRLPDLLLVEVPLYGCMIAVCVAGCAFMRWIRRRRPQTSNVVLVLWMWVAVAVSMLLFEEFLILRPGVATWEVMSPALTIFNGTRYEMSFIPDPFFWGIFWVAMISIRFFGAERIERGLDDVHASRRARSTLSTLAVIGAISASMLVASALAIGSSLYSRTPHHLPSYIRDGICGPGTQYPCPNPGVPIQTATRR